ncbi:MAG: ferrous iron transporter B [Elusimicrobiota bacterium]
MHKILLIGNPNVGKSVLFSRLTGIDVIVSNYPGSTVEFTRGYVLLSGEKYELIDVPGTYALTPTNRAEEVAVQMLADFRQGDIVINVVDAANLERNLSLTLDILKLKLPAVVALNRWDMTASRGIEIDPPQLSAYLKIPVVPVIGVSGEGVKELAEALAQVSAGPQKPSIYVPEKSEEKWRLIGEICSNSQKLYHRHPNLFEKLQEFSIKMPYAIFIALGALAGSFAFVRFIGESLINYIFDPIFNKLYMPALLKIANPEVLPVWLSKFLLGARPVPMESFGLLTTGIYIPVVILLPYIFSFYLVLSFLEDTGYLVRIAVVMDRVFHKVGLHGYASIPILLGLGCKVPAIVSTRILESRKERLITLILILMLAPCMPQTAMIYAVLNNFGLHVVIAFFLALIAWGLIIGFALNKFLKGETPELFVEIPPYQLPHAGTLSKKVYMRLKLFLVEAVPMIILGIALVNLLDLAGFIDKISNLSAPLVHGLLGLPKEMSVVMISGFLRKDVSVALIVPFNLTLKQLVIASMMLVIYLPCIATFSMIVKEFSLKTAVKVSALTFVIAISLAAFLNIII